MITLITGVPGAGKTLRAVYLIMQALEKGRLVFTDIDGFNHPDVQTAPADWRDTPEGSLVVYDEAQKTYPSTGKAGRVEDERITSLETHRHTGHDLIFITQAPTLIHHHIRKLVGLHIHVHRAAGLKRATLFTWDFTCEAPNDRREQERADTENWFYPKDLFKYYKSATIHTHKFNVPKKIAFALSAVVLVVGYVVYQLVSHGGLSTLNLADSAPLDEQQSAQVGVPTADAVAASASMQEDIILPIAGIIANGSTCRAWNNEGAQMAIDLATCLNLAAKPLPINIKMQYASGVGQSPTNTPLTSKSPPSDASERTSDVSDSGNSRSTGSAPQMHSYGSFRD